VGKERDEETGLYYYGFRYYAAWIARFINVDPLQHEYPHYTPFQYAGNKPVTYVDLDGLEEAKVDEEVKPAPQPFRIPLLPYHTTHDGTVDNSTPLKTSDNTMAAMQRAFASMINGVLDLSSLVSYNASYILENGTTQWSVQVAVGAALTINKLGGEAKEFVSQPVDMQYRLVFDEFGKEQTYDLVASLAVSGLSGALYKSNLSLGGFGNERLLLRQPSKIKAMPKATGVVGDAGKASNALVTKYPANAAIVGTTERIFLMPGQLIDRHGALGGKWLSTPGTSYGARSIPPGLSPYTQFKVLKPFEVQKSLASPGFFGGQTGFGIQFQSPVGADILIKRGIITPF
jgi:RHS repeat-associated protein